MYGKITSVILIVALLAGATSLAAAGAPGSGGPTSVGNFSFQYNSTGSYVYNLSYQGEENSYLIANDVFVNGTSILSGAKYPAGSISLANGAVVNTSKENLFLVADTAKNASTTYALLSQPVKLSLRVNMTIDAMGGISLSSLSLYQALEGNVSIIILSNGIGSVSGNHLTFTSNSTARPLFTGITTSESFKEYLKGELEKENPFKYNQTTGQVTGSFVSFNVANSTGQITNYYAQLTSNTVFTSVSMKGNTNFSFNGGTPVIPLNQPIIVGPLFAYGTNSTIESVHDNPSVVSRFIFDNGSATFNLATGLNATVYNGTGDSYDTSSDMEDNQTVTSSIALGTDNSVMGGRQIVYIHGNGLRGMLLVGNGNATLTNGGTTVVVTSSHVGLATFVAPPGLQGSSERATRDLLWAIQHNKVGSEMFLNTTNGTTMGLSVNYNNSISLNLSSVGAGKIVLTASSLKHVGNVIAVFISNTVISANSRITLTVDNTAISLTGFNATVNSTSTTVAEYAVLHLHSGILLLIHLPHFSTHSIAISYAQPSSTGPIQSISSNGGALLVVGGIVVVVAIAAATLSRRHREQQ